MAIWSTPPSSIGHDMLTFRNAVEADVPLILSMIRELASYEGLLSEVTATEEILRKNLFERQMAEVVFPMLNSREIGFALFFHNFSTFLGRPGLYIEDLYIVPEYRGKGYGRALIDYLRAIAAERGCGRIEWWCLDENRDAIGFYEKGLGARAMSEWTVYRIEPVE